MNRTKWILLIAVLVCVDQLSKYGVSSSLPLHERVEVLPFLSFYFTYNEGVAFSFLSSVNDTVLVILTIVIIGFILWLWKNLEAERWLSGFGYAFVLGGAVGNLIDRIWLGKVVDFILFHVGNWSFAVFNLADTFITIGAAIIVLDEILIWRKGKEKQI